MQIFEAPLFRTVAALRSGKLELNQYLDEILDRIDRLENRIHALIPESGRKGRLLREADALRRRFPHPARRPPLYGILVGVKDIFRTDGFPTRAGSKLPAELFVGTEAACVSRLHPLGVLILGKTVTTEFAYREPGPTRNPHDLAHTPGGSSSGSAAAVAAGFCQLALGTQTIGSVIRPASYCGVVGYKPSYGRISTKGIVPFSKSADHVGLFSQDVQGIRYVASMLCPGWKTPEGRHLGKLPALGVPEGPYLNQASRESLIAFERQVKILADRGYVIKSVRAFDKIEGIAERHHKMIAGEMARAHKKWFCRYESLYRPQTAALIREGEKVGAQEIKMARTAGQKLRVELETIMAKHKLDLWASPAATGPAPKGLSSTGDPSMNLPWTHAGLPAVTVPTFHGAKELPLGLQLVAPFMADERLLLSAEGIADVVQQWVP